MVRRLDHNRGRIAHAQHGVGAVLRAEPIGHLHGVVAGVGQLDIRNHQHAVRCVDEVRSIETPLVAQRRRALGHNAERGRSSNRNRQIRRLDHNRGRYAYCQQGIGAVLETKRIGHLDGVSAGVAPLHIRDYQHGVGRIRQIGAVDTPLVAQGRRALGHQVEGGPRAHRHGLVRWLENKGGRHTHTYSRVTVDPA